MVRAVNRSPFLLLIPAVIALALAVVRWLIQGSGNVYTTLAKRFYVADRDLGWRVLTDGPIWIGLEVIGAIAGVVVALAVAAWVIRRVERKRGTPWRWARIAALVVSVLPLGVPVAVFATGTGPDGAVEMLPVGQTAAAPTAGIEGRLNGMPEGTYQVQNGSSITARLAAGKETFDARFAGDLRGEWRSTPSDLTRPTTAEISVDAASVDTGIDLRSKHAREDYLYTGKHPRIGFTLGRLIAARQDAPDTIAFRAAGTISLMGAEIPVEVTGTLRALDAEAAGRLGLPAGTPTMIIQADTELQISRTPLAADRDSFDTDRIPIHVSLVVANQNAKPTGG
jgi:polyisoprenoid-binding protein YceI